MSIILLPAPAQATQFAAVLPSRSHNADRCPHMRSPIRSVVPSLIGDREDRRQSSSSSSSASMVINAAFIAVSLRFMCVIIVTITTRRDETRLASINVESQLMIVIMIMIMIRGLRTLCAFLSSLLLSQEVVDFQRSQLIASQHIERSINIACPRSQSDTTIDRSIVGFLMPDREGQTKAELKLCKINWLN